LADILERGVPVKRVPPQLLRLAAGVLSVPARVSNNMADKAEFARIGHYYATESMLLWDASREQYDADATPEFGSETLAQVYRAVLTGQSNQSLGEHSMFSGD
jgi:divinyl chlorophyllide a 8-vinyl-reductase